MSSPQEVYCLSLQIQSNANSKSVANLQTSATATNNNVSAATTAAAGTGNTTTSAAATTTATTRIPFNSMQQQLQQQQQQQPQQQQLTNNIILLRGSRNENGQIVIKNKHDIISFINEQQQQQQHQQQHKKSTTTTTVAATTTATLTQLPTTTTVARKTIPAASSSPTSSITLVANRGKSGNCSGGGGGGGGQNGNKESHSSGGGPTASNTILLQTPINASQLESVLLQSAHFKKFSAANASKSLTGTERPFLLKSTSRSLSGDSNRLSHADNKGPFVLQTLKRLEKSQSILVIRNSATSASSASSAASSSSSAGNTSIISTSSSSSSSSQAATSNGINERKATLATLASIAATTSVTASESVCASASASSSASASASAFSLGSTTTAVAVAVPPTTTNAPTTASVSTNTQTGALSFASSRVTKAQQTTKMIANRTSAAAASSSSATTAAAAAATTKSSSTSSSVSTAATTFLRLTSSTNKQKNISAAAAASSNNFTSNNNNNRNILNGATELSLADVQLKQERGTTTTATTSAAANTNTSTAKSCTSVQQQHLLQLQQQQQQQTNVPLGIDGEPIKLPDNLESLPRADSFPSQRHRWNTNEEIAAILISFDKHSEWQSKEVKTRPKSGSLLLYSRKKVRYRRDGYCWKKRKDGKTTREDHMKLKVQGTECIYGCYVHSAILPTFHRRCYWLLQNPDIVLVHYLNVPYPDDNKMAVIAPSITLWSDKKEWTKDELVSQLKPMLSTVTSDDDSDSGNDIEISTAETVESIVCQLMEKQRLSRQAALVKQLDCGCGDAACADGKTCSHPIMRRPGLLKSVSEKRVNITDGYNQSGSGTPNVVVGPKLYSRWSDRRTRDANLDNHHQYHPQQLPQETAIKFQIIPPQQNSNNNNSNNEKQHHASYQQQQQQHQHYRQHVVHNNGNGNGNPNGNNTHQLLATRSNLIIQQQQQQQQMQNQSNFNQNSSAIISSNHNSQLNMQRFVANHNNSSNSNNSQITNRMQIAKTTITTAAAAAASSSTLERAGGRIDAELIENPNHLSTNSNFNKINRNTNNSSNSNSNNCNQLTLTPQQQQNFELNVINNNSNSSSNNSNNNNNYNYNQQQQINTSSSTHASTQQQQQQQLYYNRQQHKQATNDVKMPPQQAANLSPPSSLASSISSSSISTVEPMCMSPEHRPLTPVGAVDANSSNSNDNNISSSSTNIPLLQQLPLASSTTTLSSVISTSSQSSPSPSSSSSFSQLIIDGNVVHQKQSAQSTDTESVATPSIEATLISSHDAGIGEFVGVDCNNDAVEMTINHDIKHIDTSNNIDNNNTSNNDNQITEYNNISNRSTHGCENLGSSNDSNSNSNSNSNNNNSNSTASSSNHLHHGCDLSEQTHTIDFETMEMNSSKNHHNQQHHQHNEDEKESLHQHHQDTLSFFNETLDLSQEDIQRTLIANLPFDNASVALTKDEPSVLHALEYIDAAPSTCPVKSNQVVGADEIPVPGVPCGGTDDGDADDVFANLDAFDMLVEFPELDLDDKQALSNTALEQAAAIAASASASADIAEMANSGGKHVLNMNTLQQQLQYDSQADDQNNTADQNASSIITITTTATMSATTSKKQMIICDFSPEWSYPEGGVKVLVAGPWTSNTVYSVLFDSQPVPTVLVQEGVLRCYCPSHEVGYATLQVSSEGFVVSNSVMFEYKMSLCQEASFDANSNDCLYKFTLFNRLSSIDEKMQIKTEAGILSAQHTLFLQSNFEEKLVAYCQQLTKRSWQAQGTSAVWHSGYKGMTLLHLAAALGYAKLVCAMLSWRAENPNIILETEIDALSQDVHGYTPMTWACARGHLDTVSILYKWNHNALKIKNNQQQTPLDIANLRGHKHILAELYRMEHERQRKQSRASICSLTLNLNKYPLHTNDDDLFDIKDGEHVFSAFDCLETTQRSHDGVFLRPVAVASNQSPPSNSRFSKRSSIDSGINMDIRTKPGKSFKDINVRLHSFDMHENFSLSVDSASASTVSSALPLDTLTALNATNSLLSPLRKMDFALCEVSTGDSSPLPDKDNDDTSTINNDDDISDINNETDAVVGDSDAKVLTLAEHIIAAMPERIKNEADEMMVLGSPMTEALNSDSSGLNDSFMDPLLDSLPNTHFDSDFSLDFNDHSYRYHDVSTPCSSLSPASSGALQSPASYSLLGPDPGVNSPSPPPSTKQLTEFLHASSSSQYPFEADFSKLTLTDTEQRELYEAAKCIQKAYRSYKGRQKLEEQNKERGAATVIQNYYRRYKQYAYYRQMTNAALVIQHGYRSYCRNKRFKKSSQSTTAASCIGSHNSSSTSQCLSSFYDHFRSSNGEQQELFCSQPSTPKETSPSGPLKRTYSQSTQNQAARKIQQFMRQSRIKLQRERAEKEKLVHQRREEYLQSLQFRGQPPIVCHQEKSESPATESVVKNFQ